MDKRALKILSNYNLLEPSKTSDDDFQYAKSKGYMFEPLKQSHDEALEMAFSEFSKCTKKNVTDLFLASLSTHRLEWRAGLPAYAYMRACPKHQYQRDLSDFCCKLCATIKEQIVDFSYINKMIFGYGGFVTDPVLKDVAFMLKQHNKLEVIEPTAQDFKIFNSILQILKNAEADDSPSKIQKKLRTIKGFKSVEYQRRILLETLGYCSILETEKHKGLLHKQNFRNFGLGPHRPRSDWHYPVGWWKGKDGVNQAALEFWFGEYTEVDF